MAVTILGCQKEDNPIVTDPPTGLISKVLYIDSTLPHPFDTISSVEYFFDASNRVTSMDWKYSYQNLQGFPQSYRFKLRHTSFVYNGADTLPYMSNTIAYIKQNYPDILTIDNRDFSTIVYQYNNTGKKTADSMINWYGYNKLDYKFTYLPGKILTRLIQYMTALPTGRDTATLTPDGNNISMGVQICYAGIDNRSFVSREITYDLMQNPFNRLNIASALYYAPPFNADTWQAAEIYQPVYFNKNNFITQKLISIYIAFYSTSASPFLENEYSYSYTYTFDGYPFTGYLTNKKFNSGGGSSTTTIKALYTYR